MAFVDLTFSYNGITSDSIGVWLIKMSTGMMESQFFGDRSLSYDMIQGRKTPYYYKNGETIQPFKVKLQIAPIEGEWTEELRENVSRWLNNGKFNEFYSTDNRNKIYFLSYIGSPSLNVTGNNEGYIDIEFQNIDCFVRSPIYNRIFDLSNLGGGPKVIHLENFGDENIQPNVYLKKIGAGNVSIINQSNGGSDFRFTGLLNDEVIFVDNANRYIRSDMNIPRYDDFSKNYMSLPYGLNYLQVFGNCHLSFNYRYLYKHS